MRRLGQAAFVALLTGMASACATVADGPPLRGSSGSVAWEVVDLRQWRSEDQRQIRWDYAIVFHETRGKTIQFDRLIISTPPSRGADFDVRGGVQDVRYEWRLTPRSEHRLQTSQSISFVAAASPTFGHSVPGGREGSRVLRRFLGKTDTGEPITVDVLIGLDPGMGRPTGGRRTTEPRQGTERPSVTVDRPVWNVGDQWSFEWESPRGSGWFWWRVEREEVVEGVEYYVLMSSHGLREILHRKSDLAYYMDRIGVNRDVEERSSPPDLRYAWPLSAGKRWAQQRTVERPRERRQWEVRSRCEVEAEETITVRAGPFQTLKIVCRDQATGAMLSERWYSPDARFWVRERTRLSDGVQDRQLTSFTVR